MDLNPIFTRKTLVICLYVAGFGLGTLLLIQHWVHVPQFLPFVLFLACPLIHLFMHRGHGGHRHAHATLASGKESERG